MRVRSFNAPNAPLAIIVAVCAILGIIVLAAFHRPPVRQAANFTGYPSPLALGRVTTAASDAATRANLAPMEAAAYGNSVGNGPNVVPPPPRGGRGPSQLIRTANLTLEVGDVGRALRTASVITDEQLGDVIGLNDETPASPSFPHTATMEIRVPQYRFEQTLDALGRLGTVKTKSVNAQDVADQIVDAQARLRNLRRTETDILNIMDRSGNIEQVLNVTQQLGSVREQIERLDAQIQGMQYQVAYSTINIAFTSPVVVSPPSGFDLLADAWKRSLASVRDLTVSLLSIGLWLAAFSPYILAVALLGWFVLRRMRAMLQPASSARQVREASGP
jgi:hypothetical protein